MSSIEGETKNPDSLEATPTICRYRSKMEQIRDAEVQRALHQLSQGQNPEQVITHLARSLTNKITHQPSLKLRHAGFEGRSDKLSIAQELLGIGDDQK